MGLKRYDRWTCDECGFAAETDVLNGHMPGWNVSSTGRVRCPPCLRSREATVANLTRLAKLVSSAAGGPSTMCDKLKNLADRLDTSAVRQAVRDMEASLSLPGHIHIQKACNVGVDARKLVDAVKALLGDA